MKPFFKDVMKFSSFIIQEVEEDQSLSPLDIEISFNEKELIEANKDYIFAEMKVDSVEIVEKYAECSVPGETK